MMRYTKTSVQVDKTVETAALLFARQGYRATSTREIARIAGISENTLFRQFKRKEDIFWAALRSCLSGLKLRREVVDSISQSADPNVVLPHLLAQLVDTAIVKPELLRLIAVGLIELNWKTQAVCYEYLSPIFSVVHRYLESSIAAGKLRNLNPSMLTAALTATVMVHPEVSKLIVGAGPPYSDSRQTTLGYTEFWLDMLMPGQSSCSGLVTQVAKARLDRPRKD